MSSNQHTVNLDRQRKLLELLPLHGWNWKRAGIEAGYSVSYASTSLKSSMMAKPEVARQVAAIKAKIQTETEGRRQSVQDELDKIIYDAETAARDRIAAMTLMGKMNGWLSERIIHERPEQQHAIDERRAQVVRRLCVLQYNTLTGDGLGQYEVLPLAAIDDEPGPASQAGTRTPPPGRDAADPPGTPHRATPPPPPLHPEIPAPPQLPSVEQVIEDLSGAGKGGDIGVKKGDFEEGERR